MRFPNTFVVFGPEAPPIVKLLSESQAKLYRDREALRFIDRAKIIAATFGSGYAYALPAWSKDCMEIIALNYTGPWERELKGICAAIALGKPYGSGSDEGGTTITQKPIKPTPRGPVGAKAVRQRASA